jgi:signal transduction histidine kinase
MANPIHPETQLQELRRESPRPPRLSDELRAALEIHQDEDTHGLKLRETDLATLCSAAVDDVAARHPGRIVQYEPDPERRGTGEWDPTRIAYAVAILLEDALERTTAEEPIRLRWREHDADVVVRVQYPRPLSPGDRFVSFFEEGVQPDGATDGAGTLRVVVARRIMQQHRGTLARVRTRAGTTYVATLPRWPSDAAAVEGEAPSFS